MQCFYAVYALYMLHKVYRCCFAVALLVDDFMFFKMSILR